MTATSKPQLSRRAADSKGVATVSHTRALRDERGFTLVEVLAAMVILIVGVLGTVSLVDGANATTSFTKGREGGTSLARELAEMTRGIDYDKVTPGLMAAELQTRPGLGDAAGEAGWQIKRRGITYTVTPDACTFDDATDKTASHDSSFCANSATSPDGDTNPDDYRRVTFDVSWTSRGKPGKVSQTALITNPSGGLGPRITAFTPADEPLPVLSSSATKVDFVVTTTPADAVRWSADDGNSDGNASGSPAPRTWNFSWQIGTVGAFSCSTAATWTLDGIYRVNAQAFDERGIPGDLRTKTVNLDRSAPAPPCGLTGGRNGTVMELQWLANPERDIKGYQVYRRKMGVETFDPIVCSLTTKTECVDENPPAADLSVTYYVVAIDGGDRRGQSADKTFAPTANVPPLSPSQLTGSIVDGQPTLTWTAATDPDGTIQFYRVYRGGTALANRYGATSGPQLSFTDKGESGQQYWVTAVDDQFAESPPVGPVTP